MKLTVSLGPIPKFLKPLNLSPFIKNLSLIFTSFIEAMNPPSRKFS